MGRFGGQACTDCYGCVEWKPAIEDTMAEHRQDELKKFLQHGSSCLEIGG